MEPKENHYWLHKLSPEMFLACPRRGGLGNIDHPCDQKAHKPRLKFLSGHHGYHEPEKHEELDISRMYKIQKAYYTVPWNLELDLPKTTEIYGVQPDTLQGSIDLLTISIGSIMLMSKGYGQKEIGEHFKWTYNYLQCIKDPKTGQHPPNIRMMLNHMGMVSTGDLIIHDFDDKPDGDRNVGDPKGKKSNNKKEALDLNTSDNKTNNPETPNILFNQSDTNTQQQEETVKVDQETKRDQATLVGTKKKKSIKDSKENNHQGKTKTISLSSEEGSNLQLTKKSNILPSSKLLEEASTDLIEKTSSEIAKDSLKAGDGDLVTRYQRKKRKRIESEDEQKQMYEKMSDALKNLIELESRLKKGVNNDPTTVLQAMHKNYISKNDLLN